jgi:parallel beta-helix repeat protein
MANSSLHDLTAHDNGSGIDVCCSDRKVIENNVVLDNSGLGIGVFFGSDSHNVIRHNRVSGNGRSGSWWRSNKATSARSSRATRSLGTCSSGSSWTTRMPIG